jgi:hypothetical protein
MSEELTTDTLVAGENVQPVNTDAEAETHVDAKSDSVESPKAPNVEIRDGKTYVDGVRTYSRDDTNRIASQAKKDAESRILEDLGVDSLDKVKSVVTQLRNTDVEGGESLNVASLRDAVKKREQTVEELRAELQAVKTDYALKEHIGTLKDNMPASWNGEQKSAVVDLMKARNMLHLDGESFAIRNGEDYFTVDGETPDYASAVKVVGQSLGLPFAKKGIDTFDVDKQPRDSGSVKALDEARLKTDPAYRSAFVRIRETNRSISRGEITDAMVKQQMERGGLAPTSARMTR